MRCSERNTVEASAPSRVPACASVPPRTSASSSSRSVALSLYCVFAIMNFLFAYFLCAAAIIKSRHPHLTERIFMKLYYTPGACSLAVHIACREAGLAPQLVRVDLAKRRTENGDDFDR